MEKRGLTCCRSSTCWLPAACFIRVQNQVELALALKIVTLFQATFAIRSVGHNPNPGFSSVGQAGIVLDLGALNSIVLSPQKDFVSVGPGATWDQVYSELENDQLTAVGGRVAGVGVGGLLLGGWLPFPFSRYAGDYIALPT
jgi:FAD/FMN-containing dehydrogenase